MCLWRGCWCKSGLKMSSSTQYFCNGPHVVVRTGEGKNELSELIPQSVARKGFPRSGPPVTIWIGASASRRWNTEISSALPDFPFENRTKSRRSLHCSLGGFPTSVAGSPSKQLWKDQRASPVPAGRLFQTSGGHLRHRSEPSHGIGKFSLCFAVLCTYD